MICHLEITTWKSQSILDCFVWEGEVLISFRIILNIVTICNDYHGVIVRICLFFVIAVRHHVLQTFSLIFSE